MIDHLDDRNIELTKTLYHLKHNLDLYKLIGLNIKTIQGVGSGKIFFEFVEWSAIRLYVIDICKIYEKESRYPLNSIPGILNVIDTNRIQFKYPDPISKFALEHGKSIISPSDFLNTLKQIVSDFTELNKNHLDIYKDFRDKRLAHAEAGVPKIEGLPSYDVMERLLFFGIDFYAMIHEAYIGGFPVQHKIDKRVFSSLHGL